jgi:hypothetical protein
MCRDEKSGSTEQYQEVQPLMQTTYERGMEKGMERGIVEGARRAALRQLAVKFGPLSPEVKQRLEALSPDELAQLQVDLLTAASLKELRLQD